MTTAQTKQQKLLTKIEFYVLSWTWGIIMSLVGAVVVGAILLYGVCTKKNYKLQRCGWCYYIAIGQSNWGGLELGMFFLVQSRESIPTMWHEHGHAIQNCFWGVLFPFVIAIPSAIRYWYRELRYYKKGLVPTTRYDSVWFEGEATTLGKIYKNQIESD